MRTLIKLNDVLIIDSSEHRVVRIAGPSVQLRSESTGQYWWCDGPDLWTRTGLRSRTLTSSATEDVDAPSSPPLLGSMTKREIDSAEFWRGHLQEILDGTPVGSPAGTPARPEYELAKTTLGDRIEAKAKQLQVAGVKVSDRTLKRKLAKYRDGGLHGLVDGRARRTDTPLERADARLIEIMIDVIARERDESTGTVGRLLEKVRREVRSLYPDLATSLPSDSSMRRYVKALSSGRHTTGKATSRRSRANSPERMWGLTKSKRPGEIVEIDSTPLDVRVRDESGLIGRVSLTVMLDIATNTIMASSFRLDAAKAVDHALLLARAMFPESVRPGRESEALLAQSTLPASLMVALDDRQQAAIAKPYIVPDTITVDGGMDYRAKVFEDACRQFGISLSLAPPRTPTHKPHIERLFASINSMFAEYLGSYTGGSVANRGLGVNDQAVLDIHELQELFETWVVKFWQNRPHEGLADPLYPSRKLTPNQMYAACVDVAAALPVPFTADDYIALLPEVRRTIKRDGIQVNGRTYDSPELSTYRGRRAPNSRADGKWSVRHDPYNVTVVWVQDPEVVPRGVV